MEELTLTVFETDLEAFKMACREIEGVQFSSYDTARISAKVYCKYQHCAFYLGASFTHFKRNATFVS